jgi:hypothetical protein
MLKNFMMKQLLKRQMKGMPEAEQDRVLGIIEKNPDFFMNIAGKVQEKMKGGMDQMAATMAVMKENEAELKSIVK